jgi:hypothetical protein
MGWELDPDFALQSRVVFGRTGTLYWTIACAAAVASAALTSRDSDVGLLFLTPGLALLFFALPYSAVQLLALERDGRFDQHRLAGRPPLALGTAVLAGASWPMWMTGAVLLACGMRMGAHLRGLDVAALMSAGIAVALSTLALPGGQLEGWLLRVGLAIVALIAAALTQAEMDKVRPFERYGGAVVLASAVAAAVLLPRVLRRLYRPSGAIGRMPSTILRPVLDIRRTRLPEMVRALLGSGAGASGAIAIAVAIVAVLCLSATWTTSLDVDFQRTMTGLFLYSPLVLAAYNVSTSIARERQTGALDRILLSGRPSRVALQLGSGFALPYLAIAAVVPPTVIMLGWRMESPLFWMWTPLAVMFAGAGLAEGVRGRGVGLYFGAVLYYLADANTFSVAVLVSGCWIPWVWSVASLSRSRGAPLTGAAAVLAAAWVGAVAVFLAGQGSYPFLIVGGLAAVGAGLFVPDGAPGYGTGTRALCVIAAGLAGGAAECAVISGSVVHWSGSEWPHWLVRGPFVFKLVFAVTGGLYAAAGILIGWLIHNLSGHKPRDSRVLRAIPLLIGYVLLPYVFHVPGVEVFVRRISRAIEWSRFLVVDFLVLACLAVAIVVLMALEWRRCNALERRS